MCMSAADVASARSFGDAIACWLRQFIQYSAVLGGQCLDALSAQFLQLLFRCFQFCNAACHVANVLIEQCVYLAAILFGRIPELEQDANFVQPHVERTAPRSRSTCVSWYSL